MNTKQVPSTCSGGALALPEPDPDNITVLAHNLPNKPILPWNHYDSPWQDTPAENADEQTEPIESDANEAEVPNKQLTDVVEPSLAPTDEPYGQSTLDG